MSEFLLLSFLGLGLLILAFPLLVLVLLFVTLSLRGRVQALEARLEAMAREAGARPAAPAPHLAPTAAPLGEVPAVDLTPRASAPPAPEPAPVQAPRVPPEPRAALLPTPVPVTTAPGPRGTGWSQLEGRLGTTWLNRAGVLVLIFGVAFFLKYAFDNDWVGPRGRVTSGLVAGVVLLLWGERLQRAAYRVPAQGLMAAGVAILYLSVYAAYGFYELVGPTPAFAFMALVTAAGMAVAIRHDARATAVLANVGGFLTPVLLSTGQDAAITLFTYLAILDAGMVGTAYWRRWPELSVLSFAFTQALYWTWIADWYRRERLAVALGAATVFFVLFVVQSLVESRSGRPVGRLDARRYGMPLLMLAAPTAYFLAARRVLAPESSASLALLCLAVAAGYLLLGLWAVRVPRGHPGLAVVHFALAVGFLTLACAVHFSERALAIAWSVEGLVLLWGGLALDAPKLRKGALGVLVLAWARWVTLALMDAPHGGIFLVDHPAFWATVAVVLTAALGAVIYRRREPALTGWERAAYPVLVCVALGGAALFVTVDLSQYERVAVPAAYVNVLTTVVWVIAAMPALALARTDRTHILLGAVTLLLVTVGLRAVAPDAEAWSRLAPQLRPLVLNPRFFAGLLIVVLYWLYGRILPDFPYVSERSRARLGALATAGAALLLLWNLSAEIMLAPLENVPFADAAKVRSAALSVLWTLYAFAAMGAGLRWRRPSLRIGAIALFGLAVAKVFLVDLSALDAAYRVLSFLVLGAVLVLASFLYTRYRRRPVETPTP